MTCPHVQLDIVKHAAARVVTLFIMPSCLYLYIFYVHLATLTKAGPHDTVMTSAFQASLEVGCLKHAPCIQSSQRIRNPLIYKELSVTLYKELIFGPQSLPRY